MVQKAGSRNWLGKVEGQPFPFRLDMKVDPPRKASTLLAWKAGLYMRSYPLRGLFLATRQEVSQTTSSAVILRPTATGISFLLLSLKHSSTVIEGRVTGVTG